MKAAHCTYTQAGERQRLTLFFDPEVFEFMGPSMNTAEEIIFIRQLADSIIFALPSFLHENKIFIKRIFRAQDRFILLCTNGFLIDESLNIPIAQQPASGEAINITHGKSDMKVPPNLLRILNERLPLFEKNIKNEKPEEASIKTEKEKTKKEKPVRENTGAKLNFTPYINTEVDDIIKIFSELNNMKKEILEMTENRIRTLNNLVEQLSRAKNRIIHEALQEAKNELSEEESKKKLQDLSNEMGQQYSPTNTEKNILELHRKIQEIAPIPNKFSAETDASFAKVTSEVETLLSLKKILISSIYHAATEIFTTIGSKSAKGSASDKMNLRADFNRKFMPFAEIDDDNKLVPLSQVEKNLVPLSLERLQQMISSGDKENTGLIQRCNTSWTEESEELKMLLKALRNTDGLIKELLQNNPELKEFSKQNMIEIIRIPFPRSYQFRFTETALQLKNKIEDYCKTQKEKILQAAKSYKRTMQIDEVEQNAKGAIRALETEIENLKNPVLTYAEALKRNEKSEKLMLGALESERLYKSMLAISNELHTMLNGIKDESFSAIKQKISLYDKDIERSLNYVKQTINNMHEIKEKMNKSLSLRPVTQNTITELDPALLALNKQSTALNSYMAPIITAYNKFQNYHQAFLLLTKLTDVMKQSNVRKEQAEAKSYLLETLKETNGTQNESLKKSMITLYTDMDNNVAKLDQINAQLLEIKKNVLGKMEEEEKLTPEKFNQLILEIQQKLDEESNIKLKIDNAIKMMQQSKTESGPQPRRN